MFDKINRKIEDIYYQIDRLRQVSVRSEVTGGIQNTLSTTLPDPGQAGRIYWLTDTLQLAIDNVTEWRYIST